jgi:hypothetical protein
MGELQMNADEREKDDVTEPVPTSKMEYRPPELKRLGDIRTLTMGFSFGDNESTGPLGAFDRVQP